MLNQFSRTQLLFGQEGMERLYRARVAVFGIGGVGGYTVEALARSGVGILDLIDDDRVCLTNLDRQLLATRKTVGQYKVDVAEQRVKEINPDAVVHTYKTFYAPQTAEQFDLPGMTILWTPSTRSPASWSWWSRLSGQEFLLSAAWVRETRRIQLLLKSRTSLRPPCARWQESCAGN